MYKILSKLQNIKRFSRKFRLNSFDRSNSPPIFLIYSLLLSRMFNRKNLSDDQRNPWRKFHGKLRRDRVGVRAWNHARTTKLLRNR